MGIIGGPLGYWFLKRNYPGGQGVPLGSGDVYADRGLSKLKTLFGPDIFDELKDKVVLDFGCGTGENAIELAKNGCRRVIGLDIQEHFLDKARLGAEAAGVADRCMFTSTWTEAVDVILTTDAFEHFESPGEILGIMRGLLKDSGYVLAEFGPTWFHPYGGHLFAVFPWAHLVFTERALIRWRTDFKSDGANRFSEVAGGLNQMTIRRWERLVQESGFRFLSYEQVPIRAARRLHCRLTREFLTAIVRARLTPKSSTSAS
jgi:SAM-dependent methyltransferase